MFVELFIVFPCYPFNICNDSPTFGSLYGLHKLQEMSEELLIGHSIHLNSKLNLDICKMTLYKELSFQKNCSAKIISRRCTKKDISKLSKISLLLLLIT